MKPTKQYEISYWENLVAEASEEGRTIDLAAKYAGFAHTPPSLIYRERPAIRAEFIEALLLGKLLSYARRSKRYRVSVLGLRIAGASIIGRIQLENYCTEDNRKPLPPIELKSCFLTEGISAKHAHLTSLILNGSVIGTARESSTQEHVASIDLAGAKILNDFEFDDTKPDPDQIHYWIDARYANVGGKISGKRSSLRVPAFVREVIQHAAVNLDHCTVNGPVELNDGGAFEGGLSISRARLNDYLLLGGSRFEQPPGEETPSIEAFDAEIKGGLYLGPFQREKDGDYTRTVCVGSVDLFGAKIGSSANLSAIKVSASKGKYAINLNFAKIEALSIGPLTEKKLVAEIDGGISALVTSIGKNLVLTGARITAKNTEFGFFSEKLKVGGSIIGGAEETDNHEVRLRIKGSVLISGGEVGGYVTLEGANIEASPNTNAISWDSVHIKNSCYLQSIALPGKCKVVRTELKGGVYLRSCRIGGLFDLSGILIKADPDHVGLVISACTIDGDIKLQAIQKNANGSHGVRTDITGVFSIIFTSVAGALRLQGGVFRAANGSFTLLKSEIDGAVLATPTNTGVQTTFNGSVTLRESKVGGVINFAGARISSDENYAFSCFHSELSGCRFDTAILDVGDFFFEAKGGVQFDNCSVTGYASFAGANIEVKRDAKIALLVAESEFKSGMLFRSYGDDVFVRRFCSNGAVFLSHSIFAGIDLGGACIKQTNTENKTAVQITECENSADLTCGAATLRDGSQCRFECEGSFLIQNSRSNADLDLSEARINGDEIGLQIVHSAFRNITMAINETEDDVRRFELRGQFRVRDSEISGTLWMDGAKITPINKNISAMEFWGVKIERLIGEAAIRNDPVPVEIDGAVMLAECEFSETLRFSGAKIQSTLFNDMEKGRPARYCLSLRNSTVHNSADFGEKNGVPFKIENGGAVNLSAKYIGSLHDNGGRAWQGADFVFLEGARYDHLDRSNQQTTWQLARQKVEEVPAWRRRANMIASFWLAKSRSLLKRAGQFLTNPFFWLRDRLTAEFIFHAKLPKKRPPSDEAPYWEQRTYWLHQQFGSDGPTALNFSPQAHQHLMQYYRRAGDYHAARHIESDKLNLEGRIAAQRWPWPISIIALAGHFLYWAGFRFGLSPTRAMATLLVCIAIGSFGVEVANQKGMLVIDGNPVANAVLEQNNQFYLGYENQSSVLPLTPKPMLRLEDLRCGNAIVAPLMAADIFIPLIEFRQEFRCTIRPRNTLNLSENENAAADKGYQSRLGKMERLIDSPIFWHWLRALYSLLGWVISSLTVLTIVKSIRRSYDLTEADGK